MGYATTGGDSEGDTNMTTNKDGIEFDIDALITDVNNKADNDLSNVPNNKGVLVENWHEGTEWYRVYSDGWCEQGGYNNVETGTGPVGVSFHKKFIDTNINISVTPVCANISNSYEMASVGDITTESFKIYAHSSVVRTCFWRACGYIR